MALERVRLVGENSASTALVRLVASDGSTVHPYLRAISAADSPARDVADALHLVCMAHGSHPGLLDHASVHDMAPTTHAWLEQAATTFAGERHYLARLVAAAGPLPRTPGHAECEAAVTAQRHALDMLGQSERAGCALGAAAAFLLDWVAVRHFLDCAAQRLAIEDRGTFMVDHDAFAAVIDAVADRPAVERALSFGAQQFLVQQYALWNLLETRAAARGD